jgi:surface antigen/uncharacterized protein YegL
MVRRPATDKGGKEVFLMVSFKYERVKFFVIKVFFKTIVKSLSVFILSFFSIILNNFHVPELYASEVFIECYDEKKFEEINKRIASSERNIQFETDYDNYEYQCVDLVKYLRKDLAKRSFGGYAHKFWDKSKDYNLERDINPVVGSVLVWKAGDEKTRLKFGHVAVVTRIMSDDKFEIIEQNWETNKEGKGVVSSRIMKFDAEIMYGFVYDNPEEIECLDGLATAIVLDRSGSMAGYKTGPTGTYLSQDKEDLLKLDKAREAAKSFILSRNDNDKVSISTFSDKGEKVQNNLTVGDMKPNIDAIFEKITASGATFVGDGLDKGYEQLSNAGVTYKKIALLLSDGVDNQDKKLDTAKEPIEDFRSLQKLKEQVENFKKQGWLICTFGFGTDAAEALLKNIAEETGCTYNPVDITNIVNKYQGISAYVSGESTSLLAADVMPPDGRLSYPFYVTAGAEKINAYTSWQGSTLNTVLVAPDGTRFDKQGIVQGRGRSEEGSTFQMLELMNPMPGRWSVESAWSVPPIEAEQVNILVTEKTDSFVRIHGFRSQYAIGEPVTIKIDAQEQVSPGRKLPLIDPRISVEVKKPGAEMIRMVQAQSSNWTVYKDVMQDVTRDIALSDDGLHDDYRENDGIFAGTFTETDKNGPYIVSATVRGKTQSGVFVEKTSIGVFQVGSIAENQVTTGQTLHYMDEAQRRLGKVMPPPEKKSPDPAGGTRQGDPLESIDALQKDDPLQSIQDLLGK